VGSGVAEQKQPEAKQQPVQCGEIGGALPRPIEDQKLLLYEGAVGNDRSCATGSQELGERREQMCEEDE